MPRRILNLAMKYVESDKVELKSIINDDLKKEIVAFLNTHGGIIYVGVNDDGTLNPVLDKKEQDINLTKIANWINDKAIYPNCKNLISFKYNNDGVLEITINEGNEKPYYLSDKGMTYAGCFKRVGRSKFHMDHDEIYLTAVESNHILFEEQVSKNQNLTFLRFMDRIVAKHIDFDEDKFITYGFKNDDGLYTNLGLLFSDQNPIVIKFAVYQGKDRLEFKLKKEFEGSFAVIIDYIDDYCKLANDKKIIKPESGFARKEILSYPEKAIREAVLNALEHANYFFRANIKIEFFEDRLEISNPGNFYGGITLEQALHGRQSFRNPKLVYVLDKLDFVENYATGIKTIFTQYEQYEKKPHFDITDNSTTVILPNLNYVENNSNNHETTKNTTDDATNNATDDATNQYLKNPTFKLTNTQNLVCKLMENNKQISLAEIAKCLDKNLSTIKRTVKQLQNNGIIKRVGNNKSGYWEVI